MQGILTKDSDRPSISSRAEFGALFFLEYEFEIVVAVNVIRCKYIIMEFFWTQPDGMKLDDL